MASRYRLGRRLWLFILALLVLLLAGVIVQSTAGLEPGGLLGA
jgi:hypothetical protein